MKTVRCSRCAASAARARRLQGKQEDALLHFEIGARTAASGLPVDWGYVAYRMAVALGEDEWDRGDCVEVTELGPATRFVLRRKGAGA